MYPCEQAFSGVSVPSLNPLHKHEFEAPPAVPSPQPQEPQQVSPYCTATNYVSPSAKGFLSINGSFILGTSIPEDPEPHSPHWDALGVGMCEVWELQYVRT